MDGGKNRWKMDNKKKDTHGEKTKEDSTQKILLLDTVDKSSKKRKKKKAFVTN